MSSALPRPLVLSYPSNRLAALALLTALCYGLRKGDKGLALTHAARTFVTWSLARELDPDHHGTSEAAVVAALAQHLWELGQPQPTQPQPTIQPRQHWANVLGDMAQLSSLRMLVASVGPAPTRADTAQLLLGGVLNGYLGQPVLTLLPAASLQLSAQLRDVHSPRLNGEAAVGAVLAAGAWLVGQQHVQQGQRPTHSPPSQQVAMALSLGALALSGVVTQPERVHSRCDEEPVRMSAQRLRLTRQVAGGVLAALLLGKQSAQAGPLALAFAVTGLRRLAQRGR